MPTEPSNADPPKRQRRWYQFSLRTLLIFTVLCAVAASWFGNKIEQKRIERDAVAAIVEFGGEAHYDYERVYGAKPPGPEWLRKLLGENFFSEVVAVDLRESRDADVGLVNVKELPRLDWLFVAGSKATDAGLVNIQGLTQLQTLSLMNTQVTDAGLVDLKTLTGLRRVNLVATKVTDAGLECLKGLNQLQLLILAETNVTDAGLENLKGLTRLQKLDLRDTKVTEAGVNDLQKALPNCDIVR